jgi:hypothetical protein
MKKDIEQLSDNLSSDKPLLGILKTTCFIGAIFTDSSEIFFLSY